MTQPAPTPPPAPVSTATVLAGLAAVFLLVAGVGIVLSGGFERREGVSAGPTTAPRPSAPVTEPPTLDVRRVDFGADVGPAGLAVDPSLGPWQAVAGTWSQRAGQALVAKPGGARSLVVVHPTRTVAAMSVTLATVAANAGLVVRYQDPTHYVILVAVPGSDAVWLAAVAGDPTQPTLLASVPDEALAAGTTIGVRIAPTALTVLLDGAVARTVTVPAAPSATGVGLAAGGLGSEATARFAALTVSLA